MLFIFCICLFNTKLHKSNVTGNDIPYKKLKSFDNTYEGSQFQPL